MRSRTRSTRYREALASLDPTGASAQVDLAAVRRVIAEEFPDGSAPIGLVSRCYLGPPYEVHIMDLVGSIIEHFEVGRPMPPSYEKARRLAVHPSYDLVEVHTDRLVAVRTDGTAVTLEG